MYGSDLAVLRNPFHFSDHPEIYVQKSFNLDFFFQAFPSFRKNEQTHAD